MTVAVTPTESGQAIPVCPGMPASLGVPDMLATLPAMQRKARIQYRPFEAARTYVRALHLKGYDEWVVWSRSPERPADIPRYPLYAYPGECQGYSDFLGTFRRRGRPRKTQPVGPAETEASCAAMFPGKRVYRSFQEARTFARSLRLDKRADWTTWCKSGARPSDIPSDPYTMYAGQWAGYGDFLGNGRKRGRPRKNVASLACFPSTPAPRRRRGGPGRTSS